MEENMIGMEQVCSANRDLPWWGSNASTGGMILNEYASYKFYRLCGVPACNTTLFHLRIVDDEIEANPNNQYDGDFWGLYLALEEPDGRFLDEMVYQMVISTR